MLQRLLRFFVTFSLLLSGDHVFCQQLNKYGALVINTEKEYWLSVKKEPARALIDMRAIPEVRFDLRYSTENNFMQTRLYPKIQTTYMRQPAIVALQKIQQKLLAKGFCLVIWDAYRPYSVTEVMWNKIGDTRYVADPAKGSGHNRGIAVDITIMDKNTGIYLNMGTGYDNFSDTAHHSFTALSNEIKANRKLLKELMIENGFQAFDTEWWHYYLPNDKGYELLDITFESLKKYQKKQSRIKLR